MLHGYLLILLSVASVIESRTVYLELDSPTDEEVAYLRRYGYMPDKQTGLDFVYTAESISEPVRKMQAFAGLPQTGVIDAATKKLFEKKRCGVKDIEVPSQSGRNRRYILQQGWNRKQITYRVINGSSTLDQERVESIMADGLAMWAPHAGLEFIKLDSGHADIQVSFAAGDHGDGFPFDGPGHVVAHAFPPPQGSMHFDDDEIWGFDTEDANEDVTDFFAAAVHEIGHALGLAHSNVKASIMYPYYQIPVEGLQEDDILALKKLYSNDNIADESTESPTLSHSSLVPHFTKATSEELDDNYIPDLCMTNYDTIQVIQGKIYVFEEEWVWVLRDRNIIEEGYPKRFHEVFKGLPASVNVIRTIYEKHDKNIVVFSEKEYWEFSPSFKLMKKGSIYEYPIPSDVPELTTVFISNYNNKTYLIEEERFWRYDERVGAMDPGYPKDMSAWRNVPYPVDAAIIWKGDTFFFRGPRFWRFDNSLIAAHAHYPLPTALIWFDCEPSPDMDKYIVNDGP